MSRLDIFAADALPGQPAQPGIKEKDASTVPPNLVEATSPTHLKLVEDTMAAYRGWQISANHERIPGSLDAQHLRALHAHLMQDVYPDVGGTRNDELNYELRERERNPAHVVEVSTMRLGAGGEKIPLLPAAEVNDQVNRLSDLLRKENHLMGLDKGEFVGRLADYYTRFSYAAPFSSGNQQVLGVGFQQLGRQAGYEVDLAHAPQLAKVTDAVVKAGVDSDKKQLVAVLAAVVTEAEGPEAALRRKITMQVVRPKPPPEMVILEHRGELLQAGVSLAQRVGGEEGKVFRASMRAIMAGDLDPAHLNQVRTTARTHGSGELQQDAARIEQASYKLDVIRREDQARGRDRDAAGVQPSREVSQRPAEITR